jgi:hypothetical protein
MTEKSHEIAVATKPLTAQEVSAGKALIQRVMAAVMKKDVHYGVIPGTKKPTLYKPGSEAILSTFRIAVIPEIQDLSTADEIRYRVLARGILPDGIVVGCGLGECSTNEEKYKWRAAVCDEEFEDTPENRRRIKYMMKWNDRTRKKEMGKVSQVRTEPADLANTVLKMAKKRAQIDLTLTATGASDVFDQDIEDLPAEYVEAHIASPVDIPKEPTIDDEQEANIRALISEVKANEAGFCTTYKIPTVDLLPARWYEHAVKALEAKRREVK